MTVSASKLLTHNQVQQVNDALAAAADGTSARIAPVVVGASARYERSEDLLGLWASALGLALVWRLVVTDASPQEQIGSTAAVASGLLLVLAVIATGFILGGLVAAHLGWLRRLFIPRRQLAEAVRGRAQQFYRDVMLLDDEHGRPLIVVYLSLYERAVEVIASEPIDRVVTGEAVESIRQVILDGLARRRPCEAICQAIDIVRDLAAAPCPPKPDAGEPSRLRIID